MTTWQRPSRQNRSVRSRPDTRPEVSAFEAANRGSGSTARVCGFVQAETSSACAATQSGAGSTAEGTSRSTTTRVPEAVMVCRVSA